MDHLLSVLEGGETPVRLPGFALFALLFVRALRVTDNPPVRSGRWLLERVALAAVPLVALVAGLNEPQSQFVKLGGTDRGGGAKHQVAPRLRLREGHHLTDVVLVRQQG